MPRHPINYGSANRRHEPLRAKVTPLGGAAASSWCLPDHSRVFRLNLVRKAAFGRRRRDNTGVVAFMHTVRGTRALILTAALGLGACQQLSNLAGRGTVTGRQTDTAGPSAGVNR